MNQTRPPVTYKDWLNELNNKTKEAEMLEAAAGAARRAPDKKAAFADVCLVLATMFQRQMKAARGNIMAERNAKRKFDAVCGQLFGKTIEEIIERVRINEPNFDRQAHLKNAEGKAPLGFIEPPSGSDKGLGFLNN